MQIYLKEGFGEVDVDDHFGQDWNFLMDGHKSWFSENVPEPFHLVCMDIQFELCQTTLALPLF